MNERKTEDLVENRLRQHGYYSSAGVIVEKQRSDTARINKLLEAASKSGPGAGKPEFIIRSDNYSDFIIVIECKASTLKHVSETRARYAEYAVDGALLYASFLSKEYDVLAIAVSGEDERSIRISHFLQLRGSNKPVDWHAARGIVSFEDYYQEFLKSDIKFRQDYNALLDYSRILNNQLQAKKITEAQRGFLISGILIALNNRAFRQSYRAQRTARQLAGNLLETISAEFENADLPTDRRDILIQAFSFIEHQPSLTRDKEFIVSLISGIDENVNTFMRTHQYYDTIGQFYVEFLRYANNDKGLGIVLTPSHIGELFAELADVDKNIIVFDNCCGTAGLLIAAMKVMVKDAGADPKIQKKIKNHQLFGIEFQPSIYALAVCNMILHGDGKANIYRGDCFEDAEDILPDRKPTVGVLNPPYKNKTVKDDKEELEFVLNNLDCLEPGGKCVAIVPITCATAPSGVVGELKRRLMERHTLDAVMSMPIELFHNSKTTVVTCIMIFTAKRSHARGKKTWFGYWRDDGFVKTKHRGRIDAYGMWPLIKERWVNSYRNREEIGGLSVLHTVGPTDEWCAEAYLSTDYDSITQDALVGASKKIFGRASHERKWRGSGLGMTIELVALNSIFKIEHGNKFDLNKMSRCAPCEHAVVFVGRTGERNGFVAYVEKLDSKEPYEAGLITVALGGSALSSFVQPRPFYTAQNIDVLRPLAPMSLDTKLFYSLCIEANRFRYSTFGREANRTLKKLPVPAVRCIPAWVNGSTREAAERLCHNLLGSANTR